MRGNAAEVVIGREHREAMVNAELGEQRIDRPDLNTCAAARIA